MVAHARDRPGDLAGTAPQTSTIDSIHDRMSVSANEAAQWFDSFFEDERYTTEAASSRIRLRPSLRLEKGRAAKLKFTVAARLTVPHFKKKLKLIVSDNNDSSEDTLDARRFAAADNTETDQTNIGLQYTLRNKDRLNTHIAAGFKVGGNHGVDLFFGPRVRKTWRAASWQLRLTERIRWYTDIGWETRTRLDIERVLGKTWFFRGVIDARVRKNDYNERGVRYNVSPTLIQKLHKHAAIEYQWNNSFVTLPNHRLEETALRIRFRKRIWRKWLFYEVNPQLAFRNDDKFRATPGVELRLEASFGGLNRKLHKK